jgi:hypothetical protein
MSAISPVSSGHALGPGVLFCGLFLYLLRLLLVAFFLKYFPEDIRNAAIIGLGL